MTDTSQLWYSLNKDCDDIPKTPVESYSDSKETTNKFSDDIKALGEYFPQLASLLNKKDSTDDNLTLEISLKEIFVLCPRGRCRADRKETLQIVEGFMNSVKKLLANEEIYIYFLLS